MAQGWEAEKPHQSHWEATARPEFWHSQRAGETKLWAQSCQDTRTRKAKIPNRKKAHWGEPNFSTTFTLGSSARLSQQNTADWVAHTTALFPRSSAGLKSKIRVLTGLLSGEDSVPSWQQTVTFPPCPHTAFPWCVRGRRASAGVSSTPWKEARPVRLGLLVTSFNTNYLLKGPVSKRVMLEVGGFNLWVLEGHSLTL